MILDDEALVERVARAIGETKTGSGNDEPASLRQLLAALCVVVDEPFDFDGFDRDMKNLARAAIEAVRVHMWDDGR